MKKVIALTLAAVFTLGMLTACGESSSKKESTKKTTTTTTMATTTTTTAKQTTTTMTSQTTSAAAEKAKGERPNIRGKATYYTLQERNDTSGYTFACVGAKFTFPKKYILNEYDTGNDFMESLDRVFGRYGTWTREANEDTDTFYRYKFVGTADDSAGKSFVFRIQVNVAKSDNTVYYGLFDQNSTIDDYALFKYIFTDN